MFRRHETLLQSLEKARCWRNCSSNYVNTLYLHSSWPHGNSWKADKTPLEVGSFFSFSHCLHPTATHPHFSCFHSVGWLGLLTSPQFCSQSCCNIECYRMSTSSNLLPFSCYEEAGGAEIPGDGTHQAASRITTARSLMRTTTLIDSISGFNAVERQICVVDRIAAFSSAVTWSTASHCVGQTHSKGYEPEWRKKNGRRIPKRERFSI